MQFQLKLPKYSSVKIQEVETNYRERMHLTEPMLVKFNLQIYIYANIIIKAVQWHYLSEVRLMT